MHYFISDIHLGFFPRHIDRERENALLNFLDSIRNDCESLFIIGDLFDYWFEYKTVIPKPFIRTLAELYNLKKEGIRIEYLMGNHDFGHLDFFETELEIKIHHDDYQCEIAGKRFYLSHGDGKIDKDKGYRILKKALRNPLSKRLFRLIHPDCGIWLASSSSHKSRHHTDNKSYGDYDSLEHFAKLKIEEGYDYVIMGHRHKAISASIGNGYYINLGEWLKNPHIGTFNGENFSLIKLSDYFESRGINSI